MWNDIKDWYYKTRCYTCKCTIDSRASFSKNVVDCTNDGFYYRAWFCPTCAMPEKVYCPNSGESSHREEAMLVSSKTKSETVYQCTQCNLIVKKSSDV